MGLRPQNSLIDLIISVAIVTIAVVFILHSLGLIS